MIKKIISGALSAAVLAASVGATPVVPANAAGAYNYAEALQMSLYFYECQQAGPLPSWNRVEWRGDSTMIDEIKGGWYDAGDHVKFNLPMSYSAAMLAWGLYQYPGGVEQSGELQNYVNNLEFVLDYLAACDLGTEAVFQVGNGTVDHTWWGPVEVYQYGMEDAGTSYASARTTLKASKGCSCVFGGMAAALAAGSLALDGRIDSSKTKDYLAHAENLFKLADASKSDDVYNDSNASGFYRSSHFYDELFWSANWLYMATKDSSYLDKAKSYIPHLDKELGSDELKYTWCQCWDDTMQGGMLLYAQNSQDATYIARAEKHVNYLINTIKKMDGKVAYVDSWGCLRYAETAGFMVAVASDTILKDKDTSAAEQFYENQINYALGDNPLKQSYVVGFGEKSAHNAHHRGAHGSWKNDIYTPTQNRHTLYGALVGGPAEDGSYVDDRNNYINNEVATDYNAGFTALLCKMIDKYGGTSDPSFPPKEDHGGPEFYVEVQAKTGDASGQTVSCKLTNHSAWPARVQDNLSFRYYMDLSEVKAAGKNPEDVVIRCDRNQSEMYAANGVTPATISKITHYDGDIYYVEVTFPDGRACLPVSEGMQQCEILLALVMPDYGSGWDSSNDPSFKTLSTAKGETDKDGVVHGIVSKYVPVYIDGKLYYGEEPDGTSAAGDLSVKEIPRDPNSQPSTKPVTQPVTEPETVATTTTTAPATEAPVTTTEGIYAQPPTDEPVSSAPGGSGTPDGAFYGDANCDKKINVSDAVAVLQFIANQSKYPLTDEGRINADIDGSDGITGSDAITIQQVDAGLVKQADLPLKK
ncbi:MAG: glycoside hydrolase family 9 protein [Ruminococcus sp.]|nr:glycoside hydrolase family 9 protein [Ruminococcus sp.]